MSQTTPDMKLPDIADAKISLPMKLVTIFLTVLLYPVAIIGRRLLGILEHSGEVLYLLIDTVRWIVRGIFRKKYRLGKNAIVSQICRIGVQSIFIVALVSGSVGLILALQLLRTGLRAHRSLRRSGRWLFLKRSKRSKQAP